MQHLPYWFSTNCLPRNNTMNSLEAPDGEIWEVSYIFNNKEEGQFVRWLERLFLAYNLEEGDICIFEVVSELELKILPLGETYHPVEERMETKWFDL